MAVGYNKLCGNLIDKNALRTEMIYKAGIT